jgi:Glycosyl transferase family 11
MITTEFYPGQGLGNQLWLYAVVRAIAHNNGYEWGIQSPSVFKGRTFMNLDMGKKVIGIKSNTPRKVRPFGIRQIYSEKRLIHAVGRYDITPFQEEVLHIRDKTKIDGVFQCEDYILPIRKELTDAFSATDSTLRTRGVCYIHFRGGDFAPHPTLLLSKQYYEAAISHIRSIDSNIEFRVLTNDTALAREYFPEFVIESNYIDGEIQSGPSVDLDARIGEDFRKLQNCEYIIISNSSFSWWAAWTNLETKVVVAPKYWARHNANDGFWSTGNILTRGWIYISATGLIQDFSHCFKEDNLFKNSKEYLENVLWIN